MPRYALMLLMALAGCGPVGTGGEQVIRRTGYDQAGRPVPRYIMEDPRYTGDPRLWDRNGDLILIDGSGPGGGGFDEGRYYREQMEDDRQHRRFLEYIRECSNCAERKAERAAQFAKGK